MTTFEIFIAFFAPSLVALAIVIALDLERRRERAWQSSLVPKRAALPRARVVLR